MMYLLLMCVYLLEQCNHKSKISSISFGIMEFMFIILLDSLLKFRKLLPYKRRKNLQFIYQVYEFLDLYWHFLSYLSEFHIYQYRVLIQLQHLLYNKDHKLFLWHLKMKGSSAQLFQEMRPLILLPYKGNYII